MSGFTNNLLGLWVYYVIDKPNLKLAYNIIKVKPDSSDPDKNSEWTFVDKALAKDWQNYFVAKDMLLQETANNLNPFIGGCLTLTEDLKTEFAIMIRPHMRTGYKAAQEEKVLTLQR